MVKLIAIDFKQHCQLTQKLYSYILVVNVVNTTRTLGNYVDFSAEN